jgi:hypothetical protein
MAEFSKAHNNGCAFPKYGLCGFINRIHLHLQTQIHFGTLRVLHVSDIMGLKIVVLFSLKTARFK